MPDIRRLIFDEQNEEHIARHGVTLEEVRDVCESLPLVLRGRRNRLTAYGRTSAGRYLLIVLDPPAGGAYYVVTARDMSRPERRRYTEARSR